MRYLHIHKSANCVDLMDELRLYSFRRHVWVFADDVCVYICMVISLQECVHVGICLRTYLPKVRRVGGQEGKCCIYNGALYVCVIRFCTQKIPFGGIFLFSAVLLWCPLVYYRLWTLLISVSHNWPVTQAVRVCWSLEWIGAYWSLDW